MKTLLVQAAARDEPRGAATWYRARNTTVAERFVAEVQPTFELIERFPATGAQVPQVTGRSRRLPVNGFPYHVVFGEFDDRLEILAIAHDRKRPGYWRA